MPGRRIVSVATRDEDTGLERGQIQQRDLRAVDCTIRDDREEHGAAIGQELWPRVPVLLPSRIRLCEEPRAAAVLGYLIEASNRGEHDFPIRPPRATGRTIRCRDDGHRGATQNGDFEQEYLPARLAEEAHPLSVWGKEGTCNCAHRDEGGSSLPLVPDPQSTAARIRDSRSIA